MAYVAGNGFRASNIKNPANQKMSAFWCWMNGEGKDRFKRVWGMRYEQNIPEHKRQIGAWWAEVKSSGDMEKWEREAKAFNKDPVKLKELRDSKKAAYRHNMAHHPEEMHELRVQHDAKIRELNPPTPKYVFGAPVKPHNRLTGNEMEIRRRKAFPIFVSRLRITTNNQPRNGRSEDDVLRELRCFVLVVHEYTSNSKGDNVIPAEVTLLSYSLAQGMQKALSKIIEYKHSILNSKDDNLDESAYSRLLQSYEKNGITSGTHHLPGTQHPRDVPESAIPLDRLKSHLNNVLMETGNKNAPILFLSENYNEAAGTLYTLFAENWEHLEARFCFLDDMAQVYMKVQQSGNPHPIRDYRGLPVPPQCPYHVAVTNSKARKGKHVDCTLQKAVRELQYLFKNLADSRTLDMDELYDPVKHTQCDADSWDTDGPQIDWGEVEQEGRRGGGGGGNSGYGATSTVARGRAAYDDSDSFDDSDDDDMELPTMREEGPRNGDADSVGWGSQHSSGGGGARGGGGMGRGGYAGSQASSGAGGYNGGGYGSARGGGGSDYGRESAKENNWRGGGGDSYGNSMRNGGGGGGGGQSRQYDGGDSYSNTSRNGGGGGGNGGFGRSTTSEGAWGKTRDPSPGFAYDDAAPRSSYNNSNGGGGPPPGFEEDARPAQRRRAPSPTFSDRSRGGGAGGSGSGGGYRGDNYSDRGGSGSGGIPGKMWAEEEARQQRGTGGGGLDAWKEAQLRGNAGAFSRPSFPREEPPRAGVFGPRPVIEPAPPRQQERSAAFEAGLPQRRIQANQGVPTAPVLQNRGTERDVDEAYRRRDEQRAARNEAQQREREQRAREARYAGGRQTGRDAGEADNKRREDRLNPTFGGGGATPSVSNTSNISSNFYQRGTAPTTLDVPNYGSKTAELMSPSAAKEQEEDEWIKSTVKFLPRGTFDKEMDRIIKEKKAGPRVAPTFRAELYSASTESRGDPLHPREEVDLEGEVKKLQM